MQRVVSVLAVALALVMLAACGGSDETSSTTTSAPAAASVSGALTVSGAASLTGAFTQIGTDFEAANPDAKITFNFDASSALATQIIKGAPADVFASADQNNMTKLTDADLVAGTPQIFARNELVIVTKPGNPEGITSLADLTDVGIVSLCAVEVPCGTFASEALTKAGVVIPEGSITRGQNVKAALTAVTEGDAVAAIVYVTDAQAAADQVEVVTIPTELNVVATYPIGVIAATEHAALADAFVAYVLSEPGQAVLRQFGFLAPP